MKDYLLFTFGIDADIIKSLAYIKLNKVLDI